MMVVVGGRTNTVGENVQLEVYETESSEWHKFDCLQRFRHTIWAIDSTIFMHGGFEKETPNIPTNSIMKIDLMALFRNLPHLKSKLETTLGAANRKNKGGAGMAAAEEAGRDGRRTPPMQSLARDQNQIRMDRAELEVNPGTGQTVAKPLPRIFEEHKQGSTQNEPGQQNTPQDSLHNLFLSHLLRPREWSSQNDGNGYFAFRREHILALADECIRVL